MGEDKALLAWDGGTLLDRAIATTRRLSNAGELFVIGDREPYRGRGAFVVPDDFPGTGPLGGIATALRRCETERLLVVGVDMPLLSVPLLDAMTEYPFEGDALVPRPDGLQPLHAIYRRHCLPAIENQIETGQYRISDAFARIDVTYLDRAWIQQFDPELVSFANANTPDDYARLREMALKDGAQYDE